MTRVVALLAVGAAVGAAVTALVFLTHRPPSWQEQEARSSASALGCARG